MSKIPILELNKRHFFQILSFIQRAPILVAQDLIFSYSVSHRHVNRIYLWSLNLD